MAPLTFMDLNDDVLHLVCAAAADIHPPHWATAQDKCGDSTKPITFCLGWIQLSHVSRRLRHICLNSSALWGSVVVALPAHSPEVMDTLLLQARNAPLNLSIPHTPSGQPLRPVDSAKLAFIHKNLGRAHTCDVVIGGSVDASSIDWPAAFAQGPFDKLQYFTLRQPDYVPRLPHNRAYLPIPVPLNTPNLLELRFCGGLLPVVHSQMSCLRKLDLRVIEDQGLSTKITAYSLVDLFSQTPMLEELRLYVNILHPSLRVTENMTRSHANLTRLRLATFHVSHAHLFRSIWSRVSVPENVKLAVASFARPLLKTYSFSIRSSHAFVRWHPNTEEFVRHLLRALPQLMRTSNIKHVSLDGIAYAKNVQTWELLFSYIHSFPAITTLSTEAHPGDNSVADCRVRALLASPSLLPNLQCLTFKYTSESTRWSDALPERARHYWNTIGEGLRDRKNVGKRVQTVTLAGYRLGNEDAARVESEALDTIYDYVRTLEDTRRSAAPP